MANQPTNEECADMFRVMMFEMMEMHPAWNTVKDNIRRLRMEVDAKRLNRDNINYWLQAIEVALKARE